MREVLLFAYLPGKGMEGQVPTATTRTIELSEIEKIDFLQRNTLQFLTKSSDKRKGLDHELSIAFRLLGNEEG